MSKTETHYQVAWFPAGSPDKIRSFHDLDAARAFAESVIDACPLIWGRTVTVSEWALVENLADRVQP